MGHKAWKFKFLQMKRCCRPLYHLEENNLLVNNSVDDIKKKLDGLIYYLDFQEERHNRLL